VCSGLGSGRWILSSSPMLFEVEEYSAAFFPGLSWWRGGKRQRSGYSPSSASTFAFGVLWICSSRAPSCRTHCVLCRCRDLWPAWQPLLNLQDGGPSSQPSSKLDASPPTSGSTLEEEKRTATAMHCRMHAVEHFGIGFRRSRLEIAGERLW
jgi:hypothetical protein